MHEPANSNQQLGNSKNQEPGPLVPNSYLLVSAPCVQAAHKSRLSLRTKVQVKHSQGFAGSMGVHGNPTYTTAVSKRNTFFTSSCAQVFGQIQSVLGRVVPIIHSPYNNDNKLNIYKYIEGSI